MKKCIVLLMSLFVTGTCKPMAQPNGQQPNQPPLPMAEITLKNNVIFNTSPYDASLIENHSEWLQDCKADLGGPLPLHLELTNLTYPQLLKVINLYRDTLHEDFNENMIADYNQEQLYSLLEALDYLGDKKNFAEISASYIAHTAAMYWATKDQAPEKPLLQNEKICSVINNSFFSGKKLQELLKNSNEQFCFKQQYLSIFSKILFLDKKNRYAAVEDCNNVYIIDLHNGKTIKTFKDISNYTYNGSALILINSKYIQLVNVDNNFSTILNKENSFNDIKTNNYAITHYFATKNNNWYLTTYNSHTKGHHLVFYDASIKNQYKTLLSCNRIDRIIHDTESDYIIVAAALSDAYYIKIFNAKTSLLEKSYRLYNHQCHIESVSFSVYENNIAVLSEYSNASNNYRKSLYTINTVTDTIHEEPRSYNHHALIDKKTQIFWDGYSLLITTQDENDRTKNIEVIFDKKYHLRIIAVNQYTRSLGVTLFDNSLSGVTLLDNSLYVLSVDAVLKLAPHFNNEVPLEIAAALSQGIVEQKSSWFSWPTIKKYSSYAALGVGAAVGLYAAYKYFRG